MNKQEYFEKSRELTDPIREDILKEMDKLFESGGIDADSFDNTYELPKILLHAALKNESNQWYPPKNRLKLFVKTVRNLAHF